MVNKSGNERGFTAVLERIEYDVRLIAENQIDLGKKLDKLSTRMDIAQVDTLSQRMDLGFSHIGDELKVIKLRLDMLERRLPQ